MYLIKSDRMKERKRIKLLTINKRSFQKLYRILFLLFVENSRILVRRNSIKNRM